MDIRFDDRVAIVITPENVAANFDQITNPDGQKEMADTFSQTRKYARKAAEARGIALQWNE